ncbi:MAG: FtsX-like permease family protein [Balneolales bacterium]
MNMLLSISWRNIWRHPARSGVLLGAIIAGLWAGIMVSALTNGWVQQRFDNLIQDELTHVQIHHPDFLTEREPWLFIENADEILAFLENDERILSYTPRLLSDAMIQSPLTASGVQIRGVDTESEKQTTTFHENLIEGAYLDAGFRNPILLGAQLAEKLNVEIGHRVVMSFQNLDNDITSGAFNVTGIFQTASSPYDERHVFVRSEDLNELIANQTIYHEIAIMLFDESMSDSLTMDLNHRFDGIAAESWYELSPELRYITDMGGSMTFYIMVIIMLALAFGILNTMLMAIFERMRELGMLMAVGMSKLRVFLMIMLESVILTLTGAIAGLIIAHLNVNYLGKTGLDLSGVGGESMAEFGYDAIVYPVAVSNDYVTTIVIVIITAVLASVYPAIKALRLNPADVVRD